MNWTLLGWSILFGASCGIVFFVYYAYKAFKDPKPAAPDPIKSKPWEPTGRISAIGGGRIFADPNKPGDFIIVTEEKRMSEDAHGVSRQEVRWRKVCQKEMSTIIKRYNEYIITENVKPASAK